MISRAWVCAVLLAVPAGASTAGVDDVGGVRSVIATSVSSRLGEDVRVTVEVLHAPGIAGAVAASALPGTRLGMPARFLLTLADGRRVSAVARVTADARHLVAARNLPRDTELTADDVHWVDGPLDGQLFDPLPSAGQVLGARARRAICRGDPEMNRRVALFAILVILPFQAAAARAQSNNDSYDQEFEKYLATARTVSLAPPATPWMASLFTGLRARNVNDLVTINVIERIAASGKADSNLNKNSNVNASTGRIFGVDPKFAEWFDPTALARFQASSDFKGGGTTTRAGELSAVITAR